MWSLSTNVLSTSTRKTVESEVIVKKNSGGAACADRLDNDNTITIRGHGTISASLNLVDFVPQADRRFGAVIVLVVEDAEARGSKQEVPSSCRLEAEPARGEHPQDMAARKQQHIAMGGMHALDHTVGPGAHLPCSLSLRTAVAEQEPARALGEDFGGATALVTAVIPFGKIGVDLSRVAEPRQLGCSPCALRRANQNLGESRSAQPLAQRPRLPFTALG